MPARRRRRQGKGLYPQGARLDRQVPRDRRGGAQPPGRIRPARRRDRLGRRIGQHRFLGAAAEDRRGRPRPHPVPVRRARDRRGGPDPPHHGRAQGAPLRADRRRPAAGHPFCGPYRRQGRAIVRRDVQGGPGRDHLQARRRALSQRPHQVLAQGQVHQPPGVRHHRLDAERGQGPRLPLAAARRP
jgi:hypothetical protein